MAKRMKVRPSAVSIPVRLLEQRKLSDGTSEVVLQPLTDKGRKSLANYKGIRAILCHGSKKFGLCARAALFVDVRTQRSLARHGHSTGLHGQGPLCGQRNSLRQPLQLRGQCCDAGRDRGQETQQLSVDLAVWLNRGRAGEGRDGQLLQPRRAEEQKRVHRCRQREGKPQRDRPC